MGGKGPLRLRIPGNFFLPQSAPEGARTLQTTDGRRHIANLNLSSRSLKSVDNDTQPTADSIVNSCLVIIVGLLN